MTCKMKVTMDIVLERISSCDNCPLLINNGLDPIHCVKYGTVSYIDDAIGQKNTNRPVGCVMDNPFIVEEKV